MDTGIVQQLGFRRKLQHHLAIMGDNIIGNRVYLVALLYSASPGGSIPLVSDLVGFPGKPNTLLGSATGNLGYKTGKVELSESASLARDSSAGAIKESLNRVELS